MTTRRAIIRRTDANQAAVVERLRALGFSAVSLHIVGAGCPDLAVAGFHRRMLDHTTMLVEIKSGDGELTPDEEQFIEAWRAPVVVARCAGDVLRAFGWADADARDACVRDCEQCGG